VIGALNEIPHDFRAVVLLIDVEELSYKEAAGILSVPIGTVMSRLSRGRERRFAKSWPAWRAPAALAAQRKERAHE